MTARGIGWVYTVFQSEDRSILADCRLRATAREFARSTPRYEPCFFVTDKQLDVHETRTGTAKMEFGVWLPVYGGWLRLQDERRRPLFSLCQNVAHIAEAHGFDYLYASENYLNCVYGPEHEVADVWIYLSALAATTSHLTLVGGVKPGFLSPFVMAHMINSLDWMSDGGLV
jgi:hypothetical protein